MSVSVRAMQAEPRHKHADAARAMNVLHLWDRFGKHLVLFFLLVAGYLLGFSFDSGDALDTSRWMQAGEFGRMVEFRHLVQRLLPFWLWQGLRSLGMAIDPLWLLRAWDLITAAASVMLLYCVLREITNSRVATFAACFLYATSHCVWGYAGSGRLYSTSMLLAFAAYYLALRLPRLERAQLYMAIGAAATLVCFAGMFWLVHAFNAIGVGLLLTVAPVAVPWRSRLFRLAVFAAVGLAVLVAVSFSCLNYARVPITLPSIQQWIAGTETPPTKWDSTSPMKAAFGQAHGILALPQLPSMVNGLLRNDPDLLRVGSLPWQLGKFILVGLLLAMVYLGPLFLLRKSTSQQRGLILALYVPLLINLYFAVSWLGTDRQRFMPSMLSIVALGALSALELGRRTRRPRRVAWTLGVCLVFIAGVNFVEVILPSQQKFIVLEAAWEPLRYSLRATDRVIDFGKDMDYQPVITHYANAAHLSLSNDVTYYDWDHPDWRERFHDVLRRTEASGGRVFVMDRLVHGNKPVEAAWSEKQHPTPTVREFSTFLHSSYCVQPAFWAGTIEYFRVTSRSEGCPVAALAAEVTP